MKDSSFLIPHSSLKLIPEVEDELKQNILPFWINKMTDDTNGGFYGRIDGHDNLVPQAEKGAILNARILWTFSAAYRIFHNDEYLRIAQRAKRYLLDKFFDKQLGGVYWSVDCKGTPLETKKQIYALAFTIYGLSEFSRATGDEEALDYATRLFDDIETHSFDQQRNGYWEAFTREWGTIEDMRLSEKDENDSKTMNTHLHILEAYANLYRIWKPDTLKRQLRNLIVTFLEQIVDPQTGHLRLFFDDDWTCKRKIYSYGHDIEASWLIHEAALVLDDKQLLSRVEPVIRKIADAADEGLCPDGSLIYETIFDEVRTDDRERHWWVQAENVVGQINLWQHFHDASALEKALNAWEFIKNNIIDKENGEWHWSVYDTGQVNRNDDKAGFWKCPYHNSRMCLEILERLGE